MLLGSGIRDCLAPGRAANVGSGPVRVARVEAVRVGLALGERIAILEPERHVSARRDAGDRRVVNRTMAGIQLPGATAYCRTAHGTRRRIHRYATNQDGSL